MAKKNAANVVGVKTKTTWKQAFKRDWQLYLLLLLPLIMVFVFSYGAYPGLRWPLWIITGEGICRQRMGGHEDIR